MVWTDRLVPTEEDNSIDDIERRTDWIESEVPICFPCLPPSPAGSNGVNPECGLCLRLPPRPAPRVQLLLPFILPCDSPLAPCTTCRLPAGVCLHQDWESLDEELQAQSQALAQLPEKFVLILRDKAMQARIRAHHAKINRLIHDARCPPRLATPGSRHTNPPKYQTMRIVSAARPRA